MLRPMTPVPMNAIECEDMFLGNRRSAEVQTANNLAWETIQTKHEWTSVVRAAQGLRGAPGRFALPPNLVKAGCGDPAPHSACDNFFAAGPAVPPYPPGGL